MAHDAHHTDIAHNVTYPADTDAVYRSEQGWKHFTKYTKWAVLHVIAILVLMAFFLI